ncbi:GATOR complex protein NPRL2-like isoform X1 [Centruroides sculpturatus]|uniref:GATOR complex protein NPRL2-like isoform X1 n=1 Tax=Centruroides sculpturatus TaxID=218467 RepID=UPI000C6E25AA|nr:GATOR complex protein NPRL2-like isoform X1 [Centruroides sculpturatus]
MECLKYNAAESPIKCIFYSEFHTTAGPKITFQTPEDYVSKEIFDALSVYIIPKPELHGKLITVNAMGYKIIGYPIGIDDPKYMRNCYIFNLCFVCDALMRTVQYEPLVRKLANYLVTLELECSFLSNEETKAQLPSIMSQIRTELNQNGHCSVPINEANTIYLKVIRVHKDPVPVRDHDVPIFNESQKGILPSQWDLTTQQWDLTLMQILPYIDGCRHVSRIAAEADVEVSLVKACIQNMVYYEVVSLIPIFQYSNVYTPTSKISSLTKDNHLQEKCIKYVAKHGHQKPTFKAIFEFYCGLRPGITVKDLCTRNNPHLNGIDERKLIQFGLMHGLIRRLQKYPVLLSADSMATNKNSLIKHFTGSQSYDEICSKTGKFLTFSFKKLCYFSKRNLKS